MFIKSIFIKLTGLIYYYFESVKNSSLFYTK